MLSLIRQCTSPSMAPEPGTAAVTNSWELGNSHQVAVRRPILRQETGLHRLSLFTSRLVGAHHIGGHSRVYHRQVLLAVRHSRHAGTIACRPVGYPIVCFTYQAKDSVIALKDAYGRSAAG